MGESTALIDTSALTDTLTVNAFAGVIEALLPIVAVAVLVGFLCYIVKWGIGLFRGI